MQICISETEEKETGQRGGCKLSNQKTIVERHERSEVITIVTKNKIKTDTVLKEFWRDNERFADLFNAALFNGRPVIRPEELEESDTELSSILRLDDSMETVQRILDVVKKRMSGVDLVILGLENQQRVHYGMPLRVMLGDSLSYLKEYQEMERRNRREGNFETPGEFLSGLKKDDRLYPVMTLCVYYGQEEWDGPRSLTDMLSIPEELQPAVSDYRMNLLQVLESGDLPFQNKDVQEVFGICRDIYRKDWRHIKENWEEISAELAVVVGAITERPDFVRLGMKEEGGDKVNMCRALEELEKEGEIRGRREGELNGKILTHFEYGLSPEQIAQKMNLSTEKVQKVLEERHLLEPV